MPPDSSPASVCLSAPPHQALLVADRAIDSDQGRKILYVVNDKDEVVCPSHSRGSLHDGLREIEDGLKAGERVIVNVLQKVRPGITVETQVVDMPRSNPKSDNRPGQMQVSASQ